MQATSSAPDRDSASGATALDRAGLARQQAALVRALVFPDPVPPGFDAKRVKLFGAQLAEKRAAGTRNVWVQLARSLGDRFRTLFLAYASEVPHPQWGHGLADGLAFARWLERRGLLTNEGRLEKLEVELRSRAAGRRRLVRTGPAIGVTLLREPRRMVLAFRLPWIGEKWFAFAAPSALRRQAAALEKRAAREKQAEAMRKQAEAARKPAVSTRTGAR